MATSMGAVSAAHINDGIPEREQLRALVAKVARIREGKDSEAQKHPQEQQAPKPANVRVWGKRVHGREFYLNADGTATYNVRGGETLKTIVADVLREVRREYVGYEPSYQELAQATAEVKKANRHIADFDALNHNQPITIPASLVGQIAA